MSTAKKNLNGALISSYTVATGQSATLGYVAVLSGADDEVDDAGTGSDLGIGIFLETAVAGARVQVAHSGIVPVTVGTGGATRGAKAFIPAAADGLADAPAAAAGGTSTPIYGIFMQSGIVGDRVGMLITLGNRESA